MIARHLGGYGLNTEVSVTARLNTILVFIYRGLAIFKLNAIITVDDPTSCELPRPSFEEFRGSTGEHIRSLGRMWSLPWNEGFCPCVRDREQKRYKQQSATAGPTLGLFCARQHNTLLLRAIGAHKQYRSIARGPSLEGTIE